MKKPIKRWLLKLPAFFIIKKKGGEKEWYRFMRWDGKRQRLIGWDGVKLWKNDSIIVGTTLEADPSFKELSVKGNVNSVF